jgi:hypothetical protein
MPVLLIKQYNILFLALLIALLIFATLSITSKRTINSILLFFLACSTLPLIILKNNPILAIAIGVLYVSMSAALILLNKIR